MAQFWYFGIRKKVSIVDATGRTRNVQQTLWAPTVFESAEKATEACAKAMQTRPGVSFFIQGFEQRLVIQSDGTSTGFESSPAGLQ